MGVTSTKASAKGGRTSSGRKSSWPSSGETLSQCQFPSLNLAIHLPLSPWVDQFMLPSPLPSIMWAEEMVDEMKGLHHQHDPLVQETDKAEKEWERMSCWVSGLFDQRADVKEELWRLKQDLKSKREELEQLKVETSGIRNTQPVVTPVFQGCLRVLQLRQGHPKRRRVSKSLKDTRAYPWKRDKSSISHTWHTYSNGTVWCYLH